MCHRYTKNKGTYISLKRVKPQKGRFKEEKRITKAPKKTFNTMAVRIYLLIITLDSNGLNAPIKRHRVTEWIRKQDSYTLPTRDSFHSLTTHLKTPKGKVKRWEKIFNVNKNRKLRFFKKKAQIAILILDNRLQNEDYKKRKSVT